MKKYFTKKNIITAAALVVFGIGGRLLLQEFPNIETIMVVAIIAGALLGPQLGLVVALFSVIGSDMIIGNTNILLYTWSAWAVIGVSSALLKRKKNKISVWLDTLKFTGWGVLGAVFFYLWTNFGVWHLTGMYVHTWAGLVQSYIMGLPFLRNQVVGTLMIVPSVSFTFLVAWKYVPLALKSRSTQLGTVVKK